MKKPTPRLFVKADAAWIARFDAYCKHVGMTRSGAIRSALERPMQDAEKGKVAGPVDWLNMTSEMKASAIRENGCDIDKTAKSFNVARETVERFAYRNHLIGPSANLEAAE